MNHQMLSKPLDMSKENYESYAVGKQDAKCGHLGTFELKVCRILELCTPNNRMFFFLFFNFSGFWQENDVTRLTANFCKGNVTREDSQRRFLAQKSVAMLEQCCKHSN